jgi:type III secretion protein C
MALALILAPGRPAAAQAPPFSGLYSHFSEREPIADVLTDFARSYDLRVSVSPALTGTVSGRFEGVAPLLFLDGMRTAFGVNWYQLGGTIYFYHESEWAAKTYHPKASTPWAIADALRDSGASSPQLPPKPKGGTLVLEGPENYVNDLESEAQAFDGGRPEPRLAMRVFKLRHAQADDVTVDSMGRSVTIPGVATILNNMLKGGSMSLGSSIQRDQASVGGLAGQGLASVGNASPSPASPAPEGQIMADPRMNAVVVSDFEDRMGYYESVINELDREVHLVEIHAAIVDVNSNLKRELGVNWQGSFASGDMTFGGDMSTDAGQFDPTPTMGTAYGGGATISTVYTRGPNFFVARIQALEREGEARLLGRPSVLTLDNQEATLENTTTYYIEVAGYQTVDLFKVDSGTVLRVTPHIIAGKSGQPSSIRLNVTVQDSQDSGGSTAMSGNMAIPPVKETKINTQALIQDGQSLLIGGYYFESRSDDEAGVPVLRRIPLIGRLFKTTVNDKTQMERMVLITPRIIRLGEVQSLPEHIDDESFSRSPTQADYEARVPKPRRGGCAGP